MAHIKADKIGLYYPVFGAGAEARKQEETQSNTGAGRIIRKRFGFGGHQIAALDNISFELGRGDRLGLIGRNGSGKTTLLRVLSKIYAPSTGKLTLEGDVAGMLDLGLGLRREASGYENIRIRLLAAGISRREIKERMKEISAYSELGQFLAMPIRTYSRGMTMRLAFSIITSLNPNILIMDEWIGAGDGGFQLKTQERMNDLMSDAGIVVIASHSHALLRDTCNLGLWLDSGEIRFFGAVDEAIKRYQDDLRQPVSFSNSPSTLESGEIAEPVEAPSEPDSLLAPAQASGQSADRHQLDAAPEEQKYEFGTTLFFRLGGNAETYLQSGWVGAEPNHIWSLGQESELCLPLSEPQAELAGASHVQLGIALMPYVVDGKLDEQRLTVQVNEVQVFEGAFAAQRAIFIKVPTEIILKHQPLLIRFAHPDCARPGDLVEGSQDMKPLAFAFKELQLKIVPAED